MLTTIVAHAAIFVPLFLMLNLAIAGLLVWIAEFSPATRFLVGSKRVEPILIGTFSILFGLFAAFLMNDLRGEHVQARGAVTREANAIRTVSMIARTLDEHGKVLGGLIVDYGRLATGDNWRAPDQIAATDAKIDALLHESLFGDATAAGGSVTDAAVNGVTDLRTAYHDRLAAAQSTTGDNELMGLIVIGLFLQITVVVVHIGGPRSSVIAVMLTTTVSTFILCAILLRLDPFFGPNAVSIQPIASAVAGAGR